MRVETQNNKSGFVLPVWVTNGGSAIGTDADPNSGTPLDPTSTRTFTYPVGSVCTVGTGVAGCWFIAGTSITVQLWFYDYSQALWIKFGPPVATTIATTNIVTLSVGHLAGARFYYQVTANSGVTAMGNGCR